MQTQTRPTTDDRRPQPDPTTDNGQRSAVSLSSPSYRSTLWAVVAVARNDWLHFLRYPLDAAFRVLQPLIWLAPVYFLGQSFATPEGNTGFAAYTGTEDYMSFIILGAILSSYVSAVFWGIGYTLKRDMDSGVLESNWMMPVPRSLFLVGRTVANLAVTTLTNVFLLLLAWLFFGFRASGDWLLALAVMLPMLLALYGFGFAFAGLVLLIKEANNLVDISDFVVSTMSGSHFPVQALPRLLLPISLALPLTYGYDAVRGFLLNTETLLPLPTEVAILFLFMAVMIPFGYGAFKRVERHCRVHGTLGMH